MGCHDLCMCANRVSPLDSGHIECWPEAHAHKPCPCLMTASHMAMLLMDPATQHSHQACCLPARLLLQAPPTLLLLQQQGRGHRA